MLEACKRTINAYRRGELINSNDVAFIDAVIANAEVGHENGDTHFVVDTNSPHDPPDCVLAGDAMTDLSFIDNYRRIRSIFRSGEKVHAVRDKTIRATDETRNKKSYKTKVKKRGTVSGGTFVKDRIKKNCSNANRRLVIRRIDGD